MPDPIKFPWKPAVGGADDGREHETSDGDVGVPSNDVYARVGDLVLRTARDAVRRGDCTEDIIGEIVALHNVHLSRGELRLLLASRRIHK